MTRARVADATWSLLLSVLILGPMLWTRGFALRGDMVFVPSQPWKEAWLGLDGAVPRFVPGDAFLSVATQVVPGDLLQKALLLGGFVLGGLGASRMVPHHLFLPRAAVVALFLWNPWVYERLAIGQWGVVIGYLCLPWVVLASAVLRDDVRAGWPALTVWLGACALFSPVSAVSGALTALGVVLARPRLASVGVTAVTALVLNLPWLVPSLLSPAGLTAADGQYAAFAARAESALGLLPSLLSLGGIWKASVVPDERTVELLVLLSVVLTASALAGLRRAWRADPATIGGLALVSLGALTLALLPAIGPVGEALERASRALPGLGLWRDSHRYLGPAVLVLLPGLASATSWVLEQVRPGREALAAVAVLMVAWPMLSLPSMAWGLGGGLAAVAYPREWLALATDMPAERTIVLPWRGTYRGYAWNDSRAVLDPAPRFFDAEVLIDDRHFLDAAVLASEESRLREIAMALESSEPEEALRSLGVRQVLVEKGNGVSRAEIPRGRVLHDGPGLLLVDLGPGAAGTDPAPPRSPIVAGGLAAASLLVASVATLTRRYVYGFHRFGQHMEET